MSDAERREGNPPFCTLSIFGNDAKADEKRISTLKCVANEIVECCNWYLNSEDDKERREYYRFRINQVIPNVEHAVRLEISICKKCSNRCYTWSMLKYDDELLCEACFRGEYEEYED